MNMNSEPQAVQLPTDGKRTQRIRVAPAVLLSDHRRQFIELCVRIVMPLGLSRSVGEIFGLIFSATQPVTFEDVVSQLGLSAGSASQGLKLLRRMGALRIVFVAGDRRDFYVAEVSLKKLLSGYLGEALLFQLAGTQERLWSLGESLTTESSAESDELRNKIQTLMDWNRQLRAAMNAALEQLG
jgi:DNA-binding transcriptional regulator GbsR (MarR family)